MDVYRKVIHNGCTCFITKQGEVRILNKQNEIIDKKWYFNKDGYPVVSLPKTDTTKNAWRSIAVHLLVALAWLPKPTDDVEVNHKDFDRTNPSVDNLEWMSHHENVLYSSRAGRHSRLYGKDNPNYGNNTLHYKYMYDTKLAKQKQSRPKEQNGRAIPCELKDPSGRIVCQCGSGIEAVEELITLGVVGNVAVSTRYNIVQKLRTTGYKGYHIIQLIKSEL